MELVRCVGLVGICQSYERDFMHENVLVEVEHTMMYENQSGHWNISLSSVIVEQASVEEDVG